MGLEEVEKLVLDSGIICYCGKIQVIIINVQVYLVMEVNGEDFLYFIWGFVDGELKVNYWWCLVECLVIIFILDVMFKVFKKRGFKFIGFIICYVFM